MFRVSSGFSENISLRYWWHHSELNRYEPDVYRILKFRQKRIIRKWFKETDKKYTSGEINVSAITVILALINSSRIVNVVELGRWVGYSTLLIGLQLQRMDFNRQKSPKLLSYDIREDLTLFVTKYVKRLNLSKYVEIVVCDSRSQEAIDIASRELNGGIDLLLIDSDHTYAQAIAELRTWYDLINPGGYIVLHDSSEWATVIGSVQDGGVKRAISEYFQNISVEVISLNSTSRVHPEIASVYPDGCGLTIIQKGY